MKLTAIFCFAVLCICQPSLAETLGFREFRLGSTRSTLLVGPEVRPFGYCWLPFTRDSAFKPIYDASVVRRENEFSPPAEFRFYREKSGTNLGFGDVNFDELNFSFWNDTLYEIALTSTGYDEKALQTNILAPCRSYIESVYGQPRCLKQSNPRVYVWELGAGAIRLSYRFPSLFERGKPTEVRLSFIRSDSEFSSKANEVLTKLEVNRLESKASEKAKLEQAKASAAQQAAEALTGTKSK
jgi:hypothetical protein